MIFPTVVASLVAVLMLATRGQAQLQPTGVGPTGPANVTAGPCATEYDANLSPRCVVPAGVAFNNLLYLVSNSTSGSPPQGKTLDQFRAEVCRDATLDVIVPCVLNLTSVYINNTRCTISDQGLIQTSSRQLLMLMEEKCTDSCFMMGMNGMLQCFMQSRIDPGRMLNSSLLQDKFPMMGSTPQEIQGYCSAAPQLFACLKQVRATCPATAEQLTDMGLELEAAEASATLLCGRRSEYQAALQCFNNPNQGVAACRQQTAATLNSILRGRYFTGEVKPSQVLPSMCRARLAQVGCELQSYAQSCGPHLELRTAFECSIIPEVCKTVDNYQAALGSRCQTVTLPPTVEPPHVTMQPPVNNNNNNNNMGNAAVQGSGQGQGPRMPNAAPAPYLLSPWSLGLMAATVLSFISRLLA